jgi:hypothetical protein
MPARSPRAMAGPGGRTRAARASVTMGWVALGCFLLAFIVGLLIAAEGGSDATIRLASAFMKNSSAALAILAIGLGIAGCWSSDRRTAIKGIGLGATCICVQICLGAFLALTLAGRDALGWLILFGLPICVMLPFWWLAGRGESISSAAQAVSRPVGGSQVRKIRAMDTAVLVVAVVVVLLLSWLA